MSFSGIHGRWSRTLALAVCASVVAAGGARSAVAEPESPPPDVDVPAPEAPASPPVASVVAEPPPVVLLTPPPASERASTRAIAAPLAGTLALLVPLVVGSLLVARDDDSAVQKAGATTMLAGMAMAPLISHAIAGRWGRALAFGAASVAASAATFTTMAVRDPFDPQLGNHKRLPFGFLLTTSFFFSAAGVVDSYVVGPKAGP